MALGGDYGPAPTLYDLQARARRGDPEAVRALEILGSDGFTPYQERGALAGQSGAYVPGLPPAMAQVETPPPLDAMSYWNRQVQGPQANPDPSTLGLTPYQERQQLSERDNAPYVPGLGGEGLGERLTQAQDWWRGLLGNPSVEEQARNETFHPADRSALDDDDGDGWLAALAASLRGQDGGDVEAARRPDLVAADSGLTRDDTRVSQDYDPQDYDNEAPDPTKDDPDPTQGDGVPRNETPFGPIARPEYKAPANPTGGLPPAAGRRLPGQDGSPAVAGAPAGEAGAQGGSMADLYAQLIGGGAEAAPVDDFGRTMLEAGLAMMVAGSQPGATAVGALGQGGLHALAGHDARRSAAAEGARDDRNYRTEVAGQLMDIQLAEQKLAQDDRQFSTNLEVRSAWEAEANALAREKMTLDAELTRETAALRRATGDGNSLGWERFNYDKSQDEIEFQRRVDQEFADYVKSRRSDEAGRVVPGENPVTDEMIYAEAMALFPNSSFTQQHMGQQAAGQLDQVIGMIEASDLPDEEKAARIAEAKRRAGGSAP